MQKLDGKVKRKVCVQCLKSKPDVMFKEYVSRSTGMRVEKGVGRHTVCMQCEQVNRQINYFFKKVQLSIMSGETTIEDYPTLVKATQWYTMLAERGGRPKGNFARNVLGLNSTVETASPLDSALDDLIEGVERDDEGLGMEPTSGRARGYIEPLSGQRVIASQYGPVPVDSLKNSAPVPPAQYSLTQLLKRDLVDTPENYNAMLDDYYEVLIDHYSGELPPDVKELYEAVAQRLDEYEDQYWATITGHPDTAIEE